MPNLSETDKLYLDQAFERLMRDAGLKPYYFEWRLSEFIDQGSDANPTFGTIHADSILVGGEQVVLANDPFFSGQGSPKTRYHFIPLENWRVGNTAPVTASVGTTPQLWGWKLDSGDRIHLSWTIPPDIDLTSPVLLSLTVALTQAELVGNAIEWTFDYVAVGAQNFGGSGLITKTATVIMGSSSVIDNNGEGVQVGAIYDIHIPIDVNDPSNPFGVQDWIIAGNLHRTTVGGVGKAGEVLLTHACLEYKSKI